MRAWSLAILLSTTALPALAQTAGTHGLFDSGAGANPGIGSGTVTPQQIQTALSSMLGQPNGVAGLDGNAFLPTANLPAVPVAKLPVGAGGVASYSDPRILGAVQASGGDFSGAVFKATYAGAVAVPMSAWTSLTISLTSLGAKPNDATSDTAALNQAITDAQRVYASTILLDQPVLFFTSPGGGGFGIPSNTTVAGLGMDATKVLWNDNDGTASGSISANLFEALLVNNVASNITFRDFNVTGSWNTYGTLQNGSGAYPFLPYDVTNLRFERVGVYDARLMSISPRQSTHVVVNDCHIAYGGRDGINLSSDADTTVTNNWIEHVDDDAIAVHSATSDSSPVTGGVLQGARRDAVITGNYLLDTEGIHDLSARDEVISDNVVAYPRGHCIAINEVPASGQTGTQEGFSAGGTVLITNNVCYGVINRYYIDNLFSNNPYVLITGDSARAGTYGAIPGTAALPGNAAGEAAGTIHVPYYEHNANSTATTVPTAANANIIVSHNIFSRELPANPASGGDSRFTTFSKLLLGNIFTRSSEPNGFDGPLPDAAFRGVGVQLYGGAIRNLKVVDNLMEGLYNGLEIGNGGVNFDTIDFRGNTIKDMNNAGVSLDSGNPATLKGILNLESNLFDLDPFHTAAGRGLSGSWQSATEGPVGILDSLPTSPQFSVVAHGNWFRNVSADTNIDPSLTPGASGYLGPNSFYDNIDFAQIAVPNAFSTSNKGIGLAHTSGFKQFVLDSDPTSATYDTLLFAPPQAMSAEPTAGGPWVAGTFVWNSAPVGTSTVLGWMRRTTGTGEVDGTDWTTVPLNALTSAGITVANSVGGVTVTSGASYYNTGATSVTPIPVTFSPATGTGAVTATGHVAAVKVLSFNYPTSGSGAGYSAGTAYPITDGSGNTLGTITPESTGSGGSITTTTAPLFTYNTNLAISGTPAAPFTIQGGTAGSLATVPDVNVAVLKVAVDPGSNYPTGVAPTVAFGLGSAAVSNTVATGTAQLGGLINVAGALQAQGSVVSGSPTGAYTIAQTDCGTTIKDPVSSAHVYTVPTGLSVGCRIDVVQAGSGGTITFAGGSGETLEQTGTGTLTHATTGQYAKAQVLVDSASTFLLSGQVQ